MHPSVYSPQDIMTLSPVIPVIAIEAAGEAVHLAQALLAGGVQVLEITLRTAAALEAIKILADEVPEAVVGAGTVLNVDDLQRVQQAGAKFAISPGSSRALLSAATDLGFALLPGVATASDIMHGLDLGYSHFKLFPAVPAGGIGALQAFAGPFPTVRFCPTGGISQSNFLDFLALDNVLCIGGSWIASSAMLRQKDYAEITRVTASAVQLARSR